MIKDFLKEGLDLLSEHLPSVVQKTGGGVYMLGEATPAPALSDAGQMWAWGVQLVERLEWTWWRLPDGGLVVVTIKKRAGRPAMDVRGEGPNPTAQLIHALGHAVAIVEKEKERVVLERESTQRQP